MEETSEDADETLIASLEAVIGAVVVDSEPVAPFVDRQITLREALGERVAREVAEEVCAHLNSLHIADGVETS